MTSSPLQSQGSIRVKCVIAPFNDDASAFLVCDAPPTREAPDGYQTLVGGGVEFGESLEDAIVREVQEELGASICGLRYVGVLENRFHLNEELGHEIVFVYAGRLDRIDLKTHAKASSSVKRGGQSLNRVEYDKVLAHLLAYDARSKVPERIRSRWSHEERAAKVQNAVDLTLLQMATGLRIHEALTATWDDVVVDAKVVMRLVVDEDRSKTHRARTVPVLDPRVATRMLERQNACQNGGYVIGAPTDTSRPSEPAAARKSVAVLYDELAAELGIPLLATARTHVWRATLNTLLLDEVPEVMRAAFFGHTGEVNRSAYTDTTDVSTMIDAAERRLRVV